MDNSDNNKKKIILYDQLPVFKLAYDLHLSFFTAFENLSRDYKYAICEEMKKSMKEVCVNIFRANVRPVKGTSVALARENLEMVRLDLRVLQDLKQINTDKFVDLNIKLEGISKQLAFWHRAVRQREGGNAAENAEMLDWANIPDWADWNQWTKNE
ncbi:MAG: four helix bundle protein [Prevotellaceae bacterium]|jgi:hypothetical protein|nr:four helix bundle protein [Prevotellaceae bacterium]